MFSLCAKDVSRSIARSLGYKSELMEFNYLNTFHFEQCKLLLYLDDKSRSKLSRNRSLNLNEITHSIDTCQNIYLLFRLSDKNLRCELHLRTSDPLESYQFTDWLLIVSKAPETFVDNIPQCFIFYYISLWFTRLGWCAGGKTSIIIQK